MSAQPKREEVNRMPVKWTQRRSTAVKSTAVKPPKGLPIPSGTAAETPAEEPKTPAADKPKKTRKKKG